MNTLKRELMRFIVAGVSAVATDFIAYMMLHGLIGPLYAKSVSFILGSIVSYIINKMWTFDQRQSQSKEIVKFVALYCSTLGANVLVNTMALYILPGFILFAFLVATGTSTLLNYLGMKLWVFQSRLDVVR